MPTSIVEQTLDRDAGCFEVNPQPSWCTRGGTGYYWDATNQNHPNFQDYLSEVQTYQSGIGHLPVNLLANAGRRSIDDARWQPPIIIGTIVRIIS